MMLRSVLDILCLVSVAFRVLEALDYGDLEALGVNCPERDSCGVRRNDSLPYLDKSCECDLGCEAFGDCCVDAVRREADPGRAGPPPPKCLHVGERRHSGVYVVADCSATWNGSAEVRQKCVDPADFRDPLFEAPVTSPGGVTYKNLYCAECNGADMTSLLIFQFKVSCAGLEDLTDVQIMGDLQYDTQRRQWGISRLDSQGTTVFVVCRIVFDVPSYLNLIVRFCRSNLVSTCAPGWTHLLVRHHCEEYMAVVYKGEVAYRNPHCALCNRRSLEQVACRSDEQGRKKPLSFALLLDVNLSDGDQVGMTLVATPECPSGYKYDPFFKRCRKLVCALPNFVVIDDKCTPMKGCQ